MDSFDNNGSMSAAGGNDDHHDLEYLKSLLRRYSNDEAVDFFDKVIFDTSSFGKRKIIKVGGDCAFQTKSTLVDDKAGVVVIAETRYTFELDTWNVNVDANRLGKVVAAYSVGGVSEAVRILLADDLMSI